MPFDVNKIIEESLKEATIISESIVASGEAAKRAISATSDTVTGGSAADEAAAAKEYALKAIEKAGAEDPGVLDKIKEAGKGTGEKVVDAVKEHPIASGAVAAAIAAGLGALALRKRLKNAKK